MMMSDNGTSLNPNWPLETGNNGPFRGGRVDVYEGGVRTAFVVRWPGKIPAGSVCHEMVSNIDVLPTVMAAAAIEIPDEPYLDGRDIAATLAGEAKSPHEILFFEYHKSSGARQGRWKIARADPKAAFELFDLFTDPGETTDRSSDRPEIHRRLVGEFSKWSGQFSEPAK